MPTPRLIHPLDVTIESVARSTATERADAREPIQHVPRAAPVTLKAQVNYTAMDGGGEVQNATRIGRQDDVKGYALFRYVDLDAASITLEEGDRFTSIGHRAVNVYVTRVQDIGHYVGRATLVRAYFESRNPTKRVT